MNKIGLKYQNFKTSTLMLSLLPFLVAYWVKWRDIYFVEGKSLTN